MSNTPMTATQMNATNHIMGEVVSSQQPNALHNQDSVKPVISTECAIEFYGFETSLKQRGWQLKSFHLNGMTELYEVTAVKRPCEGKMTLEVTGRSLREAINQLLTITGKMT